LLTGGGESEEDEGDANEDTAYSTKSMQRTRGGGKTRQGRELQYTSDEGDKDLKNARRGRSNQDEESRRRRSKSLKRIGTSHPFRNKDGSIDKRRVRDDEERERLEREGESEENGGGRRNR